MGLKFGDIVVPLVLNLAHFVSSKNFLSCNGSILFSCGENEICDGNQHKCVCIEDFERVDDHCEHKSQVSSNVTTTVLITMFALLLIVGGLVLVIRKYNLVNYVRRKINARMNNNVVYEDVMIGQDVPPITP